MKCIRRLINPYININIESQLSLWVNSDKYKTTMEEQGYESDTSIQSAVELHKEWNYVVREPLGKTPALMEIQCKAHAFGAKYTRERKLLIGVIQFKDSVSEQYVMDLLPSNSTCTPCHIPAHKQIEFVCHNKVFYWVK